MTSAYFCASDRACVNRFVFAWRQHHQTSTQKDTANTMMIRTVTALARSLQPQARSSALRALIHVGDKIPNVELHKGFPPEKINLRDYCQGAYVFVPRRKKSLGEWCHKEKVWKLLCCLGLTLFHLSFIRQIHNHVGSTRCLYTYVIDKANSRLPQASRRLEEEGEWRPSRAGRWCLCSTHSHTFSLHREWIMCWCGVSTMVP